MKKNLIYFRIVVLTILMAGIGSCEGDKGEKGDDGTDGNANVTSLDISFSDMNWVTTTYITRTANMFSWDTAAVSQDIIDFGAVLGYAYLYALDTWYPLPFIYEAGGITQNVVYSYSLNNITLYAYTSSGLMYPSGFTEFRFILITDYRVIGSAGPEADLSARFQSLGVDINDFSGVSDYLGL